MGCRRRRHRCSRRAGAVDAAGAAGAGVGAGVGVGVDAGAGVGAGVSVGVDAVDVVLLLVMTATATTATTRTLMTMTVVLGAQVYPSTFGRSAPVRRTAGTMYVRCVTSVVSWMSASAAALQCTAR